MKVNLNFINKNILFTTQKINARNPEFQDGNFPGIL